MSRVLISVLILHTSVILLAQRPDEELARYSEKYPSTIAVRTIDSEMVYLSIEGDSIKATAKVHQENYYVGDNPSGYSKESVYSSEFRKATNVEAYSLIPGKRKYSKLDVEDFKESFEKRSFVFYDDGKEIAFNYPSLVRGSKSVLTYDLEYRDPRMISMFFFQTYLPIEKAEHSIVYDSRIDVEVEVFNDPEGQVNIERKERKDGQLMIVCTMSDVPKFKFESKSPSFQSLVPTVHFRVNSFKIGEREVVMLKDVDNLHQWYQSFIHKIGVPDESIQQLVNELITQDDSDYQKMRTLYYWVQQNVRYIAFEDGMRGFVPHTGGYVLEKRYGDCKDMSSIIVDMLRAAGLEAYHTWIGTRDIPYGYNQTPTPIVDNHMIATCQVNGEWYFLDATGSYTPLGYPTSMIQGKQSLISMGNSYKLLNVPVISSKKSIMRDSVYVQLDEGKVLGTGEVKLTGYAKVFNNYRLIKSNKKEVDDYVNRLLSKGSNKFLTTDYRLYGTANLDTATYIKYDFNIADYYREIGNKIYFNLVLDQSLQDDLIENRKVPVENEYQYTNQSVASLKIPEGYEVEYVPQDEQESNDFFTYSISYDLKGDMIIANKSFAVNYLTLDVDQFEEWNTVIKQYTRACKNALVLTKKSN